MIRALQKLIFINSLRKEPKHILVNFAVILIILILLAGCESVSSSSYTSINATDSKLDQSPQKCQKYKMNANSGLAYGEFIWLLLNKLGGRSINNETAKYAEWSAKISGDYQSISALNSNITIQEVAQLLSNTQYEMQKYDISQFDWQIFDIDGADKSFRTSIIDAYANGLLITQNGYIYPRKTLQYRDAISILECLTDKSKRVLPRGMRAPYFEYKGLVEIKCLDPSILIDLKYAATENFTGKKHYSTPLCLMEVDAAKALVKASNGFQKDGYFIKIWDAYRPEEVQWSLYYATPSNLKKYVPPPSKFSQHSKGIAADITLVDKYQEDIPIPTGFDNFTIKANIDYNDLPKDIIDNREYLMSEMKKAGFSVNKLEWWHYYLPDKSNLDISEVNFNEFIEQRDKYYLQVIKQKSMN